MLNISNNKIYKKNINFTVKSLTEVENKVSSKVLNKILFSLLIITILILFLPWTQNVRTTGNIIALKPDQEPQKINSIIGGQIEKWYVKEGDKVNKNDTLLVVKEIKDAYFDDSLLIRTQNQIALKELSITVYDSKIENLNKQLELLINQRDLKTNQTLIKIEQNQLKVISDSVATATAFKNYNIALKQYQRTDSLFRRGLKSLIQLEQKKIKLQQVENYKTKQNNDWLNNKNQLLSNKIELNNIILKNESEINKIETYILTNQNEKIKAESDLNKLKNQYSNYAYRKGLYYILSPQDGYVTKVINGGIGLTIKPSETILTLMPSNYSLASEVFIKPVDLPLIQIGQKVRLQFDGWPAIVFSGWPNVSHGTYGGEVYAIDQYISENGKYRLLIKPDKEDECLWPDALRYGGGVSCLIMLNEVPIWYELWRKINGFPPIFYTSPYSKNSLNKNKK